MNGVRPSRWQRARDVEGAVAGENVIQQRAVGLSQPGVDVSDCIVGEANGDLLTRRALKT